MKKLAFFVSLLLLISTSCNKEETFVPKGDNPLESGFSKVGTTTVTKMIAGGGKYDERCSGTWVGNITVVTNGTAEVTYQITQPGWVKTASISKISI